MNGPKLEQVREKQLHDAVKGARQLASAFFHDRVARGVDVLEVDWVSCTCGNHARPMNGQNCAAFFYDMSRQR